MTPGQKESTVLLFSPLVLLHSCSLSLELPALRLPGPVTCLPSRHCCLGQVHICVFGTVVECSPGPCFHSNASLTSLCRTEGVRWARGLGWEPFPDSLLAKAGRCSPSQPVLISQPPAAPPLAGGGTWHVLRTDGEGCMGSFSQLPSANHLLSRWTWALWGWKPILSQPRALA